MNLEPEVNYTLILQPALTYKRTKKFFMFFVVSSESERASGPKHVKLLTAIGNFSIVGTKGVQASENTND